MSRNPVGFLQGAGFEDVGDEHMEMKMDRDGESREQPRQVQSLGWKFPRGARKCGLTGSGEGAGCLRRRPSCGRVRDDIGRIPGDQVLVAWAARSSSSAPGKFPRHPLRRLLDGVQKWGSCSRPPWARS